MTGSFRPAQSQKGDTIAKKVGMKARGNPRTQMISPANNSGDWDPRNNY